MYTINHKNKRLWFNSLLKAHGQSKTFFELYRARTRSEPTSVHYIVHIDLKNLIHIDFIS